MSKETDPPPSIPERMECRDVWHPDFSPANPVGLLSYWTFVKAAMKNKYCVICIVYSLGIGSLEYFKLVDLSGRAAGIGVKVLELACSLGFEEAACLPKLPAVHSQRHHVFNISIGCELFSNFSSDLFAKFERQQKLSCPEDMRIRFGCQGSYFHRSILGCVCSGGDFVCHSWYLMVQNLMLRMSFCSIWILMFSACQLLERGTWKVLCFHLHQCSVVGWACDHWKGGGEWECDGICLVVGSNCAKNQEVQDYCLESANVFDFHFISFCIFYSLLRLILLLTHRWSCCDILIHSSLTL